MANVEQIISTPKVASLFDSSLLTIKRAIISASASGNTSVVAAVTGKKIAVLSYNYMANGAVNVKFQSSNTSDISGLAYLIANTGKVCDHNPGIWFETVAGEALNINLSAAIAVGGELTYIER
jgi:hypothetical protein